VKIDPLDHLDLVRRAASGFRSYTRALSGVIEQADMEQAGFIGLMQACERYDESCGASFATFAGYRIRGAIYDWLRDVRILSRNGNTSPKWCSLDALADDNGDGPLHDITDDRGPSEAEIVSEMDETIAALTSELPPRDATIARLYYQESLTQAAIGRRIGVSEARVSQIFHERIAPNMRQRALKMGLRDPGGARQSASRRPDIPSRTSTGAIAVRSGYRHTEAFRQRVREGMLRAKKRRESAVA
jgi:RNA polymerase sigma factor FliA